MADNSALLGSIFQMVTNTLAQNKQSLDQADDQNHDHGTNMVQTFQTITRAVDEQKNSPASDALAHAAQLVSKESKSGSGQLYAQGLAKAAAQMQGQPLNQQTAVQMLQTLISGGQSSQPAAQPAGGDILGSLLGSLTGAQEPQQQAAQPAGGDLLGELLGGLTGVQQPQQPAAQPAGGDLLGSLLGGLTGGGATPAGSNANANNGLDLGDLVNAGMAYMQAKQSGGTNTTALLQAVMAGSGMGNTNHRAQSTQLVVNSFLQALGGMANKAQ
jgi:hypothetical protein